MPPTRNYDRDLIAPLEAQGDWDAQVEAECEELRKLLIDELIYTLPDDAWQRTREAIADRVEAHTGVLSESAQEWLRQYIIETFGTQIATDRLHGREGR